MKIRGDLRQQEASLLAFADQKSVFTGFNLPGKNGFKRREHGYFDFDPGKFVRSKRLESGVGEGGLFRAVRHNLDERKLRENLPNTTAQPLAGMKRYKCAGLSVQILAVRNSILNGKGLIRKGLATDGESE